MRKHIINVVLLFLVGAAAATVWLETRDSPAEPLISTPRDALQRVAFEQRGDEGVALERRDDGWWLAEPVRAPADPAEINRLLGVAEAPIAERFRVSEVEPEELGLADPGYRLSFDDSEIAVGGLNPVSRQRYLQRGDTVLQIQDPAGLPPPTSHARLVHKQLLAGSDAALESVQIGERRVERADGGWRSNVDGISDADARRAGEAWSALRAMWVRPLDSEGAGRGESVSLQLSDGSRVALTAERGEQLLIRRPDYRARYHVARNKADLLLDFAPGAASEGGEAQASEPALPPPQ